jgi:uridine kinase
MQGDQIVSGEQQRNVGKRIAAKILPRLRASKSKYAVAVAGESGSGKSTTAAALAAVLTEQGIACVVLQQDDYYVYPPRTNDHARRNDPDWHGSREVNLELLDQNIREILDGQPTIRKPLVDYAENRIDVETINTEQIRVVIAEGGYVTLLKHVQTRVFMARTYLDTRAARAKRARHPAELDTFTEHILQIEHEIISAHKANADIIVTKEYEVI